MKRSTRKMISLSIKIFKPVWLLDQIKKKVFSDLKFADGLELTGVN